MTQGIELIGVSRAIRAVKDEVAYCARSDAKILLTGESGTGKEVVARLIHAQSARRHAPFVAINCAGVPDSLLEPELFGHVRGSFTGAYRDRGGLLEAGNRGTVFLDEVGETSLRMQSLLLRFLETGEVQRVGADRNGAAVNVRIIAATNRNLVEQMATGAFRSDLYYRLNVIHIMMPPLRDRRDDIPLLLQHFMTAHAHRGVAPSIAPEALDLLVRYQWPGNVRELKNVVERLLARSTGARIGPGDLPAEIAPAFSQLRAAPAPAGGAAASDTIFDRILSGESFWTAVYEPFMARDLTRAELRRIVARGLQQTRGNYRVLVGLFNMPPEDYKRFLNFLRKHDCHMPFQHFRTVGGTLLSA